jgi:hypothetical protein
VFAKRAIKNSLLGRQTVGRALSPRSLPRGAGGIIPGVSLPPAGGKEGEV